MAAALVMCLPQCMTSCTDDNIDNPVTPATQPTAEPTDDAVEVTTEKSYVLYGVPSEGIGEAVCRRLKGSETAPFMAEVYVIDPSKTDELGIGVENWKEMVRRTWNGDAAVVLTQCSYRNFYRFTVNYVLGALALKAEMNGEELDLGNYDSKHVSFEREVLANAVRNAYQMYRANHSAPGEVTEKDWAHIDQWPEEEQNAIMLDAYGFCQGNELYVMNAAVNKPDTINGQIIPVAQPETAYEWGQKADAVTDWINRQGKEDAETRAGLANFRRAITRADESSTPQIADLMKAQKHEAVLDYKYPKTGSNGYNTAYGAIKINHQVYSAYQFDASNSGSNIEYYQVRQQITVRNDKIYGDPGTAWYVRTGDGNYNLARGAWMHQIYTKMKLEGKGTKSIMFVSPTNKNGGTSGSTTTGGSEGISLGYSEGLSFGVTSLLTASGSFNFSKTNTVSWSNSQSWNVADIETTCDKGTNNDPNEVRWIHNGYEPRSDRDTDGDLMKQKGNLTSTCTTDENVIWEVQHPEGTYKLKAYFHVMAAIVKIHNNWGGGYAFEYSQSPFDISFVLNTPNRYKYTWSNDIYNYGSAQGNSTLSQSLRDYINEKYGSKIAPEEKENRCWGGTFTTSEATKNGSANARFIFQTFKNRVHANKQAMKAAGFGGQIEFVLKPADDPEIIESFILDLDNMYPLDLRLNQHVNGYKLTFKVTKDNEEVELESVAGDFQGVLNIPAVIYDILKVTALGTWCCDHRYGVTEVHVPEGVKVIKEGAFYSCGSLTKLYLPSTITEIEKTVFYNTTLKEIHIKATTPPDLYQSNFDFDTHYDAVLYVPKGYKEAYAYANGWNEFWNIVEE